MVALNDFLMARHAHEAMMAQLDVAPGNDFRTVALATMETPLSRSTAETGSFGRYVNDGASLDLQLVAFNDEVVITSYSIHYTKLYD